MTPTGNTIALKKGQRWWWNGSSGAIIEVLEDTTFNVGSHNSVRCKVVQTFSSYRTVGGIDWWTFGDCLDRWEFMEGQDAPS